MTNKTLLATLLVLGVSNVAGAGGHKDSIGVGAETELNGMGGASINYDAGAFHVGGFLGFHDTKADRALYELGGRFFYHMHSTAMSDFGLGGTVALVSVPNGGMMSTTRTTLLYLEPSFQIRLFVASNVALSFTTGLVIGAADAESQFDIGGQGVGGGAINFGGGAISFTAGAGVHYYFF